MPLILRCKKEVYLQGESEPSFVFDKMYPILLTYNDGMHLLNNEMDLEHTVGGANSEWFNKHFDIVV